MIEMTNLAIKEKVKVNGISVPNINGGFGQDKKAMLALHIAEIHEKELKFVNRAINMNREKFKDNIDIIDAKGTDFEVHLMNHEIMTQNAINRTSNIYLLSERGYAKLIKIFSDNKSWELYDVMLDEYFDLRDGNIIPINNKPLSPAEMLVVYAQQFLEQEQRLNQIEEVANNTNEKVTHITSYLTESPDFKAVEHAINKFARTNNMQQMEVRNFIYRKLEDMFGINVQARAKNAQKKLQNERVAQGKKPYAESTLKSKINAMTIVREEKLEKTILEILAGL